MQLIKDQNGNHVIQKIIKRVSQQHTTVVIDICVQHLQQLAVHAYGCRVVQRLLKHYNGPAKPKILQELHGSAPHLISDQYGNYVTQHIIQYGSAYDGARMMGVVRNNLVIYAKQKFASNVVEKCISYGSEEQRKDIMLELAKKDEFGDSPLPLIIKDNFGNYVIRMICLTIREASANISPRKAS